MENFDDSDVRTLTLPAGLGVMNSYLENGERIFEENGERIPRARAERNVMLCCMPIMVDEEMGVVDSVTAKERMKAMHAFLGEDQQEVKEIAKKYRAPSQLFHDKINFTRIVDSLLRDVESASLDLGEAKLLRTRYIMEEFHDDENDFCRGITEISVEHWYRIGATDG